MATPKGDQFRWFAIAPAMIACALGGIYALGAVSIFGQFHAADLDAVQTMPLVPIDQILARGIGAIINQALLGLLALAFAYAISAIEDIRDAKAVKESGTSSVPQKAEESGGTGVGGRLGIVLPVVVAFAGFFLPLGLVTMLGAGILAMQAVIPRVRDTMVRRGYVKWRAYAFLAGYGAFLLASAVLGAFTRASPLPITTLTKRIGAPVHGGLVAVNGSNWFVAKPDGKILTIPENTVARVTISYSDDVEDESIFQMLKE